jgi:hypothetical protein
MVIFLYVGTSSVVIIPVNSPRISTNNPAMRLVRWYVAVILHFGPSEILKLICSPRLSTIFCILAPGPEWRRRRPMALSHAAATGTGAVATAAEASHGGTREALPPWRHPWSSTAPPWAVRVASLPLPSRSEALVSPSSWLPAGAGLPGLFFELCCRLPPSVQRCHALAIIGPCPCVGQGPASKRR